MMLEQAIKSSAVTLARLSALQNLPRVGTQGFLVWVTLHLAWREKKELLT